MARHRGKYIVLFAALFILTGLTAQSTAYVPDFVAVSEQPETIDADGQSTTSITAQLMATLPIAPYSDVVKKCGVKIICESERPGILNNGTGGSTLTNWTDAFGKASFTFISTGSGSNNEGIVEVICRSLQLVEGSSNVTVKTGVATHFHITQCPNSGYDDLDNATKTALALTPLEVLDAQADIRNNGYHVYITAQLKNDNDNPVHKNGTVEFVSMNPSIVKTCGATNWTLNTFGYPQNIIDMGKVLVKSDIYGVATAELCSAGGIGTVTITIRSLDYNINATANVTTTGQYGTTYKDGYLAMTAMPDQIMADDGASCVSICAQARDQDYRITLIDGWEVLIESENTGRLTAEYPATPTDLGLNRTKTNTEGIAQARYCSAGKIDPDNVGPAIVRASTAFYALKEIPNITVDLRTEQIWPVKMELKPTMPLVDCDGNSTVTVTAQLLDKYGLATKLPNRTVIFTSDDITRLKDLVGGGSTINRQTDSFGKAHATFITTDCKFGGNDGSVTITVTSSSITNTTNVTVIKPLGFVPDAISVYSDQGLRGFNAANPAHAKPFLISADGLKPVYVTAQICEWVNDTQQQLGYCNPVKRNGVEVQFMIDDSNVVQYRGDNPGATDNGTSYVKLKTDSEGQVTAIFRSAGNSPVNKNKCTLINVTAQDIPGTAYAQVCSKGKEGTTANSIWIWADPAIISADGTSHTVIRSALYFCEGTLPPARTLNQTINYTYLNETCKPAQMQGVTVKFETMNTDALDDGMNGYKIYAATDKFGQANATFQSKGSDTQHITGAPGAEIQTWTLGSGGNIVQLNKLLVRTEEKTWPWCQPHPDWYPEVVYADSDGDKFITDSELIEFIVKVWMPINLNLMTCPPYKPDCGIGYDIDQDLIRVIVAWLNP